MLNHKSKIVFLGLSLWLLIAATAQAHVTPNVKLLTTREAVSRLLPANGKLFMKNVALSPEQTEQLEAKGNWDGSDTEYQFFVSRDENHRVLRAAILMTEHSRHGPMVVAVGLSPEGKVTDAVLTDIQTEPMEWVGPLLRAHYLSSFQGKGAEIDLTLADHWKQGTTEMAQAYAVLLANAVKRSAQLFELVFNAPER